MSKKPTYNIVTHAHWDREWYLSFEEYRTWLVDMVDELFDRLESDPDFDSFLFDGQVAMPLDYLEIRKERLVQFKEYVRKKKFIIGPWYILTDQFLPSGESHIRNLLYGLSFSRELGEPMMVGYVPDQFGHIAQMPQILKGFGIDSAVIYRGFGGEPGQESSEYSWRAPDGTTVLMAHLPKDCYSFGYFGSDKEEEFTGRFKRVMEEIDPRAQTSQRLVLNGGDHHWADPNVTKAAKKIAGELGVNIVLTNLGDYMSKLKAEVSMDKLPVVDGEMRFGIRYAFAVIGGTASSRMYVKQANYEWHNWLERVLEPLNAIAVALGKKSRGGLVKHAWKYVLQSQDHDVICGSSVDSVYEETMVRYAKVKEIAKQASTQILNDIIPFDGSKYRDDQHLFLVNLLPYRRGGVVECDIEFFLRDVIIGVNPDVKVLPDEPRCRTFKLVAPDGKEVPYQLISREDGYGITYSKYSYPHQTWVDRWKIVVSADRLPAMGYSGYSVVRDKPATTLKTGLKIAETSLENHSVKVNVEKDGSLTITDKETGEVFPGLNTFEDSGDIGDEYTFCPPDKDKTVSSTESRASVRVAENGPLRGALEIRVPMKIPASVGKERFQRSAQSVDFDIVTTVCMTYNSKRVDIKTTVDNNARDHRLRALFNSGINTDISFADSQFTVVKRKHRKYEMTGFKFELPQNLEVLQRFVTIQQGKRAITVFTKGLPEYELKLDEPGILAVTLLRSVGHLSSSNLKTRPGGDAGWKNETPGAQCLGMNAFEYSILVHQSTEDFAEINRHAEDYNSQIITTARKHRVDVPHEASYLELKGNSLAFSAFKESEDRTGIIFRCYNLADRRSGGSLSAGLPIKTVESVTLEEKEQSRLDYKNQQTEFAVDGHSIFTIKLQK